MNAISGFGYCKATDFIELQQLSLIQRLKWRLAQNQWFCETNYYLDQIQQPDGEHHKQFFTWNRIFHFEIVEQSKI